MLITADQILAHMVGDYLLQSHWMATEKTKKSVAALAHALCYSVPFMFLSTSTSALVVIAVTHFIIDRWRLARFVVAAKNALSPPADGSVGRYMTATGYPEETPTWLAVWLLIIADNILHVAINGLALKYL